MSSKKIYLIRHGQTEYNRVGIVQGSGVDSDLNDYGRAQAQAFFETYQRIQFDKIYTSALKRSIESVQGFIGLGIPHEALKGLNEISWGKKEGQKITPEEDVYYHDVLNQWREGNTGLRIEGGESPEDVVKRLSVDMNYILSNSDEKTILICMHGRAIRILLCYLLERPLYEMDSFEHSNLGLYRLEYQDEKFSLTLSNDVAHFNLLK